MKTSHTPGPWVSKVAFDKRSILTINQRMVAQVYSSACDSLDEADANGLLIAAAPSLLDALVLILESPAVIYACNPVHLANARLAIERAKGE